MRRRLGDMDLGRQEVDGGAREALERHEFREWPSRRAILFVVMIGVVPEVLAGST